MKKAGIVVVAMLLSTAFPAVAGDNGNGGNRESIFADLESYRRVNLQQIERNYLGSLEYPMDAIVESALREITRLKLAQPCCSSEAIKEKLEDLSVHGNTPAIRFKAALASIVFDHPEMFVEEGQLEYTTGEEMFSSIAHRLERTVLAEVAQ